ncbi:MAG TPA: carboxymuconolactone decarboxylase family protein [Acidimicrobiales bacterium]|nr:carboxymuconolactone decarboxylase family protein [Acidimicrobiales bacterium]
MPLVSYVPEEEATGEVRAVYDEILASRGLTRVPNFWRAIAHDPAYLRAEWEKLKAVMAERLLDRRTKEIIAVAVSATNNCDYCLHSHTDNLRAMGMTDAELVELLAVVDFFNGSNAVASGLKVGYEPPVADGGPDPAAG